MPKQSFKIYPETFKLEVLRDYYSSGLSIIATSKKWGLSAGSLFEWIRRYPIDSELLSLSAELLAELKMKKEPKSREILL